MGGMAEILLARAREQADHLVVIKRMHRQLAADRESVQMFLGEARLATTLHHPNVVEVYEIGQDNDLHYIAMEHLHGHDLRSVLSQMATQRVPMRLGQALAIARGMCRGLEYTHERTDADGVLLGIVHRDVSPHNVVLTYNGRVKLVDFGIAKASTQGSRTRTGIVKGKVAYMSPEQAMGDELDRRSDVFCIGIMLWEMTTGRRLYRRKSELESLKALVEADATRPSTLIPNYPLDLEQVVMKALARDREQRWATAAELDEAVTTVAKQRRVDLAPSTLATLMSTAFREEFTAWQAARRAGISLGDHLVAGLAGEASTRPPDNAAAAAEIEDLDLEDLPTTVILPKSARTTRPSARSSTGPALTPTIAPRRRPWWIIAACIAFLGSIGLLVATIASGDEPAPARLPAAGKPAAPPAMPPPSIPARPAVVAPSTAASVGAPAASPIRETTPAVELRRPVAPKPRTVAPKPRTTVAPKPKDTVAPARSDVATPAPEGNTAPAASAETAPATREAIAPTPPDATPHDAAAPAHAEPAPLVLPRP